MERKLVLTIPIFLLVASCVPIPPLLPVTPLPTISPQPTKNQPSIPTPTHRPTSTFLPSITETPPLQARLLVDTQLYPGPDNEEDGLVQLKSGTVVFPLATFGDFVQVEVLVDEGLQTGYIGKPVLDSVPAGLHESDVNEVPWQSLDLIGRFTLFPNASFQDDTIINDFSSPNSWNFDFAVTVTSRFKLTFQVQTDDDKLGAINLADKPDSTTINYWQGIRNIAFATEGGMLRLGLRDGIYEFSAVDIPLGVEDSQTITVTFLDPFGKVFVISDRNDQEIKRVDVTRLTEVNLPDGLFPQGIVYVGMGSPGSVLRIHSLSMEIAPSGIWSDPSALTTDRPLRQLAEQRGITIGTDYSWWNMSDPDFWNIMFNTYDTVSLAETSQTIFWSGIGEYDFSELDRLVDWSIRNNFKVRVSSLVWGRYDKIPGWLRNSNYTREQYMQILEDNIKTVVDHFKGRVAEWSIVAGSQSPPLSRSPLPPGDFWNDKIGPEYFEMAFRWAREADPQAVLIFNTDNNESPRDEATQGKIDHLVALVKDLKSKGVPIDVVGMQMHLLVPWNSQILPQKSDVIQTMRRFAYLGVSIYITEFDLNLQNIPGTQEERWDVQAKVYRDMLDACLESGVCKSFSTWGVSDSTSWQTCGQWWCLNFPKADPLMFDGLLQPKPAYYAVRDALAGDPSPTPMATP